MATAVTGVATYNASRPPLATVTARPPRVHLAAAALSSRSSSFLAGGGLAAAAVAARLRLTGTGGSLGCKCLFGLGVPELAVIAGVAALVFGPKQLPEISRRIGKTVKGFQQAAKEFETELKKEPEDGGDQPRPATPKAVSDGEQKKELEASSAKEST